MRHGAKALFLGRFTGFLRSTMPFVVGSSGVPLRRLLPYSVASGLVWTVTFVVIGYARRASPSPTPGDAASRVAFVAILLVVDGAVLRSCERGGRADARGAAGHSWSPISVSAAGAMNSRTSVTSTSTAVARPMPVILITGSGSVAKPMKTAIMIAPAAVTILRVPADAAAIASRWPACRPHSSLHAREQEHVVVGGEAEQDREHEQRHVGTTGCCSTPSSDAPVAVWNASVTTP